MKVDFEWLLRSSSRLTLENGVNDADIPEAPGTEAFLTALHLTADMRNHFEGWRNVIGEGQARYVYLRPDHLIGNQAALLNSIRGVLAAGVTCAAAMERRH
ncbi:uncharacterized protein LOC129595588 isoform X3 [Paramacrobiotus metropolitanus]|uniref:uncharacterized protein LOC129595588 isoform X3 n=1 Tax=Paramacrobiotus metropolitanus TaxID=2943436 RepID=UPI0024464B88|nr:uncharacterized protein LOC129595588 isoform X3 [Paramacrobiotus metropolitanus]